MDGNLNLANKYLGRDYHLSGIVVHGDHLGRTLEMPTANIEIDHEKLCPKDGVYAAITIVDGRKFNSALSIGTRPTLMEAKPGRKIEVHLLNFEETLYGKRIDVYCKSYIRPQLKFDSLAALRFEMKKDLTNIKHVLAN